ncbi:hypothetical protein [Paenibacillus bovis]|uniref:Uncharacterized protein n=1 Tax=Paenibacillus bovis TaxID=1616788 RepID=A0A1X9T466_9BACL|nr:hypothetical protein [Paenibacillus bovis]ARR10711.1 hypothetical protein AR543_p0103 [Paenibacillus bovis]
MGKSFVIMVSVMLLVVCIWGYHVDQQKKQDQIESTPTFEVQGLIESIRTIAKDEKWGASTTYYIKVNGQEYPINTMLWDDQKVGQVVTLTGNNYGVLSVESSTP